MKLETIITAGRKRPGAAWLASLSGPGAFWAHACAAAEMRFVVEPPLVPYKERRGWFTASENEEHRQAFITLDGAVDFSKTIPVSRFFGDTRDWPVIYELTKSDETMTLDLLILTCAGGAPSPLTTGSWHIEDCRRSIWATFYQLVPSGTSSQVVKE